MKNREILGSLFSSKLRVSILEAFMNTPDSRYYVRELSRKLKAEAKNVSRELEKLENIGLLKSERQGPLKYHFPDKAFFLYPELKAMMSKSTGIMASLRAALERLKGIEVAFVFGSYSSGNETSESDIDVLIVGSPDVHRINEVFESLEKSLGREVNYLCFDRKEFNDKKQAKDPFIMEVLTGNKLFLIGSMNDI